MSINTDSSKTIEETSGKKRVQLTPEDKPLDITRDPVFKAVLTRETPASRHALRFLVSAAINQQVTVISVIVNEPPVNDIRNRQIRYDISVRFNNGNLGNIEMTVHPNTNKHLRQEFFLARLFTTQNIKGTDYDYTDLRPAYQISFLGTNFYEDNALVHRFEYYDKENNLSFNGLTSIIDIELIKAEQFLTKPVSEMTPIERWSVFFRYVQDPMRRNLINEILNYDEGVAMVTTELLTVSEDDIMRARLESELKNELDWQDGIVSAKRAGYKQAAIEYDGILRKKDTEIRKKDEEIQALEQAEQERQRQAVKNLRGLGLSDEQIAAALNLCLVAG
ncbi:Rpn family recombination-promoting nuclease/putative transposase [Treponema primitia]|uniref:PD-(D/E)XK nuclease family transposase n=1 Tax=Treponema primitia TaxID=88058 RepID=UPI0039815B15